MLYNRARQQRSSYEHSLGRALKTLACGHRSSGMICSEAYEEASRLPYFISYEQTPDVGKHNRGLHSRHDVLSSVLCQLLMIRKV